MGSIGGGTVANITVRHKQHTHFLTSCRCWSLPSVASLNINMVDEISQSYGVTAFQITLFIPALGIKQIPEVHVKILESIFSGAGNLPTIRKWITHKVQLLEINLSSSLQEQVLHESKSVKATPIRKKKST